jgi:core-2/I-Branching enzyme
MSADRAASPRFAYVIMSHVHPPQVLRLAQRLRAGSPAATVVIHHDDRHSRLDDAALEALGSVHVLRPPTRVRWGWTSQLDVLLRCLERLVAEVRFDWMVMLSGQDYPIRPLPDIERDLATGPYDGYIEGIPVARPPWTRGPIDQFSARYYYRYRPVREPGRLLRRSVTAARPLLVLRDMPWGVLLGRRSRAPFSPSLPCRSGADWFSLSRRAVEAVVRAARWRPELLRHYRRTILPTESFPQTVLYADPGLRLSGDFRRFTSWPEGDLHPRVLRLADLGEILSSGADFARKFDMTVDSRVMDELDRVIGVRSQ